jgi:hypothetical protein
MNWQQLFIPVRTILVIDRPSEAVPETLALAGFAVAVKRGPSDYSVYETSGHSVSVRNLGAPPAHVDLIYAFRPLSELPQILSLAKALDAKILWIQSGLSSEDTRNAEGCWISPQELESARNRVESAGLTFISEPYITGVVGRLRSG